MPNTKNDIKALKTTVSKLKKQADGMGSAGARELYPLIQEINSKIEILEKEEAKQTPPLAISNEIMDTVRLARNQKRPTTLDYIKLISNDFIEMHGDRRFADDEAIVGGVALIDGIPVTIIGHQKGRNTKDNIRRHFGMAHPEGYRKALRLMEQAERYGRPIITFVDTPGAYPGIGAEERGQAEAIAYNMYVMSGLKTPIITFITGEGGSGGALGLAVADKVFMLSNTIYSVISPEGCATILWKDALQADKAAAALKLSAKNIKQLGTIIDDIIEEPGEGAHTDKEEMAKRMKTIILRSIKELVKVKPGVLVNRRYDKFRNMGVYAG